MLREHRVYTSIVFEYEKSKDVFTPSGYLYQCDLLFDVPASLLDHFATYEVLPDSGRLYNDKKVSFCGRIFSNNNPTRLFAL